MSDEQRVVVWFSCGAASAVAAKLAIDKYGPGVHVVYCDVSSDEHPDSQRFFRDVEKWLGVTVERVRSDKYSGIDDVFDKTRYMSGIAGARCTVELKKLPRFAYQKGNDINVFGMTYDEKKRADRLEENNPELECDWILIDQGVTKAECHAMLAAAGIEQPMMYKLGFNNNNCIGCVKASSIVYWKKVRLHFPEVFARRAKQSRELGVRLVWISGERSFLDEIPETENPLFDDLPVEESISCGPDCMGESA